MAAATLGPFLQRSCAQSQSNRALSRSSGRVQWDKSVHMRNMKGRGDVEHTIVLKNQRTRRRDSIRQCIADPNTLRRIRGTSLELVNTNGGGSFDCSTTRDLNSLPVRIDGNWYDLGRWASKHPAGKHWIEMYRMRDASDVFHAFHSDHALRILKHMPKMKYTPEGADLVPDCTPLQKDFSKLREKLLKEGWFERDWIKESGQLLSYVFLLISSVTMAHCGTGWLRALAFLPLGCSHCYVGWLAHDFIHGRGKFCEALRNIGGWGSGFSATMWSDKHNTHHAMTNLMGTDEDLSGGPLLWLWSPDPSNDRKWRSIQHIYVAVLFSLLHVVWRIDSITVAWRRKLWDELIPIAGHYVIWLSIFSVPTFVLSVLFGGLLMANITSTTHQSEELLHEYDHDWIRNQFRTTRNARCLTPFTEWLWGGMQYQLEHHLFPTMPRYKYPSLVSRIKTLAKKHGMVYKESTEFEIIAMNYMTYARVANEGPTIGAPSSRSGVSV